MELTITTKSGLVIKGTGDTLEQAKTAFVESTAQYLHEAESLISQLRDMAGSMVAYGVLESRVNQLQHAAGEHLTRRRYGCAECEAERVDEENAAEAAKLRGTEDAS